MNQTTILIRVPLDPALYPPEDVAELDDAGLIDLFREGGYDDIYGERSTWTVERDAQGPTVLRAGVLPILDDLKSIATALDFENTPGACSAWRRLEEAIGTLAKLTAPPTTQTEKG